MWVLRTAVGDVLISGEGDAHVKLAEPWLGSSPRSVSQLRTQLRWATCLTCPGRVFRRTCLTGAQLRAQAPSGRNTLRCRYDLPRYLPQALQNSPAPGSIDERNARVDIWLNREETGRDLTDHSV